MLLSGLHGNNKKNATNITAPRIVFRSPFVVSYGQLTKFISVFEPWFIPDFPSSGARMVRSMFGLFFYSFL